ncbi:hypothetical protein HON36_02535 [Candidatus Parcubacteria bacterium]|nr:hypothetical protein [Candidatus Parcubacteria bacterium]MBT7228672.1 hypothetical protein [Candidatus Parcubacteria bacterium]
MKVVCKKANEVLVELKKIMSAYSTNLARAKNTQDLLSVDKKKLIALLFRLAWHYKRNLIEEHYKKWFKLSYQASRRIGVEPQIGDIDTNFEKNEGRGFTETLDLQNTVIDYLPRRLTINGDLDLSLNKNTNIKTLPDDLIVIGTMTVWQGNLDVLEQATELYRKGQIGELEIDSSK